MDRTIIIKDFPEVSLFSEDKAFEIAFNLKEEKDGVYIYKFSIKANEPTSPEPITLRWRVPSFNMKGVWKCGGIHDKRQQYDWELVHLQSRISVDAPVISVFGHDDANVMTFACSDAINLVEMNALLREEDNHLYCHLAFFSERHPEITEYETEIRVDVRSVLYSRSLQDVSRWWETFESLKPAPTPALAKAPLYSTWYQFHQDLEEEVLLEECKIAASFGYELIILDDGWQTMDNNRGYDYTGDWEPDRFPDMVDFVEKIHQTGMQFGLWYSVPFCGPKSKAYQRFKGKFLTENHRWAPVFDPRYPEVREYLINTYTTALKEWNLDAFKLDFIDDFKVYPETILTKENGRDYANVNAAVDRLLTDVMESLRAIKPDIAIEFRQQYVGPTMRKFGNMFRAFDCPNDAVSNRIRITDVKLLCGASAVHSDPQTWHKDEQVEIAALQVLNGFFGVPQMSIHLRHYPESHLNMVRFYTEYWNDHADIILEGTFTADKPLANYPLLKTEKDGHLIVGVYDDVVVDIAIEDTIDLLNGKMTDSIIVRNGMESTDFELTIWDCEGNEEWTEMVTVQQGVFEIGVKPSGMVRFSRIRALNE
jgi:alpha-galactosidase